MSRTIQIRSSKHQRKTKSDFSMECKGYATRLICPTDMEFH